MLVRQIERVQRASQLDRVVVATSYEDNDDPVAALSKDIGVECYRGSLENVLERYYGAASTIGADAVVRLTADCPLSDPEIIDALVVFFNEGTYDYACNTLEPTWPHGLDAEIFSFESLSIARQEAVSPTELEHVTSFFYSNPDRFRLGSLRGKCDLSHYRWTVDYPEDLQVISRIYEELYCDNPEFTTEEVTNFLNHHPEVQALNSHINTRAAPRVLIPRS